MTAYDDLLRARELLDAQTYQPNPYDRLMTEALNSAEQTGRDNERRRIVAELRTFADDLYGITGARWIADALTSTLDRISEGDEP